MRSCNESKELDPLSLTRPEKRKQEKQVFTVKNSIAPHW